MHPVHLQVSVDADGPARRVASSPIVRRAVHKARRGVSTRGDGRRSTAVNNTPPSSSAVNKRPTTHLFIAVGDGARAVAKFSRSRI